MRLSRTTTTAEEICVQTRHSPVSAGRKLDKRPVCPRIRGDLTRDPRRVKRGEPWAKRFLHSNRNLYNPAHARNTVEHHCAWLAVAHLGPLDRRTGSEISA